MAKGKCFAHYKHPDDDWCAEVQKCEPRRCVKFKCPRFKGGGRNDDVDGSRR